LLALRVCVQEKNRFTREGSGEADADLNAQRRVCEFVARSIAPIISYEDTDDSQMVGEDPRRDQVVRRVSAAARDGLPVLREISESWHTTYSDQVLFTIIAYGSTGLDQPWASSETTAAAEKTLSQQMQHHDRREFIVETILKGYIRPLFSKSRPTGITESGRKAAYAADGSAFQGLESETPEMKPWKYIDLRAITVFGWALQEAIVSTILNY